MIDLGICLHLERTKPYSLQTPVLICAHEKHQMGIIVDEILGLYELTPEDFQKENQKQNPFFLATMVIAEKLSLLVNMPHIFAMDWTSPEATPHG